MGFALFAIVCAHLKFRVLDGALGGVLDGV